ncbi:hypothetical protein CLNEO_04020 [Anaerotignum neopropionicum]|uniref:Carbohydrate-binding domain-containing protein n=1 Tax=Anaerotignum neopropionicum TaxID=36847 RepID=A0A136WHZ9_9FIRM|nr:carbohydrate-binding domain-containing protein [Anaerotignum neopropionicum]KXL54172.1 hypothetical protein CLNEO_02730 [Anaerotignum neopropionicum]KXL54297.1 hypothetical protein CLNEO_04020 [Anaerotignum neopropionicum]
MKQRKRTALAVVTMACLLCSCNQATAKGETTDVAATDTTATQLTALNPEDLFTSRDKAATYDESEAVSVALSTTKATTSDSSKVSISGAKVTIKEEGVYVLSGQLTNGQIIIDAEDTDKVQLVLKGVTINCDTSAAIYVRQADKVFITLAANTTNTLSNKNEFVAIDDNSIDGVIYAKDDLTINGSGTLTINAAYGSGVVGKDDLTITGGTYKVTAAAHGFAGKDSIAIADGTFQITSGKDGFHSENKDDATKGFTYVGGGSYTITAQGDGFDSAAILQVDDGTFQIKTGGGATATLTDADASAKGIKAGGNLLLTKGTFTLDCADDAFHSNGNLTVKNGTYTIATGDDGFHADAATIIEDGTINITTSYEGIEGETVLISAGTIHIVASDDGINAAESGEDTEDTAMGGGQNPMANGERPAFDAANAPTENGERPTFDPANAPTENGERPTFDSANAPQANGQAPAADGTETATENANFGGGRMGNGGGFGANANCDITISGGKITLDTKGDSIDSNGTINITGGEIYITGAESGADSPIDSDGSVTVTGGIIVACGSNGMFNGFGTDTTQGWAQFHLTSSQTGAITVKSGNTTILSYTPTRAYPTVLISSPLLKSGSTYTITMGSETQTFTMDGLSYTSGTATNSFGNRGNNGTMTGTKPDRTTAQNGTQTTK